MFSLLIGGLLGVVAGLIIGFIPGFSLGFAFLLIGGLDPLFGLGFIITADAVSSVVKQLNLILPSATAEQVYVAGDMQKILRKREGASVILTANFCYTFIKIILLVGIGTLITLGQGNQMILSMAWQGWAIILAALLWGSLIIKSGKKAPIVIILLIGGAVLGVMSTKISGSNVMFALSTSLFGIGAASQYVNTAIPEQKKGEAKEYLPLYCIFIGAISSLMFGLPGSAVLSAFKSGDEDVFKKVAENAVVEASSSAIGIMIVLVSGGSRSASATMIAQTLNESNIFLTLGIIGITILLTLAAYLTLPNLIPSYISMVQAINPKVISYGLIIISIIAVLASVREMGFVMIAAGFCFQQAVKQFKAPQEVALISMSAIPLLGLLGI